jgi:zinc and cadmium transporter
MIFLYILLAVIIVSLISIIGLVLLSLRTKTLHKITHLLVSFAAGSMIGGALLHILPESIDEIPGLTPFLLAILGILIFFMIEKVLHWRHCHEEDCKTHNIAYLNLFGDAIHNFMDGVAIAGAFIVNIPTGIATTFAIMVHEIPQELGDFGILIHSGISKAKAICYNLLSAISAIIGAMLTYLFASYIEHLVIYLMPLVAGGFLYMAGTDLLPELHKEKKIKTSIIQLIFMLIGIALMWIMKLVLDVA